MRLAELFESYDEQAAPLSRNQEAVLPPVFIVKNLNNSNSYQQYRFNVDMASARAVAAGEVQYKPIVPWVQYLAVVGYTPEDIETIRLAAKQAGYTLDEINDSPSHEPDWVNKVTNTTYMKNNIFYISLRYTPHISLAKNLQYFLFR